MLYTVIGIISLLILGYWLSYGRFKTVSNLPGPPITLFQGHFSHFQQCNYQLHLFLDTFYKVYGRLFTIHHQGAAVAVVAEEEMVQEILCQRFKNFKNRKFFIDLPFPCPDMPTMINGGDKWQYLRKLYTALLTCQSLKNMTPHVKKATDMCVEVVGKSVKRAEYVDITSLCKGFVMELITSLTFSIDCPNQSDFSNKLISMQESFTQPPQWVNDIAALPFGERLVKYFPNSYKNNLDAFIDVAKGVVTERRKSEGKYQDILQALLDAQESEKRLADDDILAQGIIILTAVHKSTSTTLAAALHLISQNKDVQKKIHEELDSYNGEKLSWDHLAHHMTYLGHVIQEVMRMYPATFMLLRECVADCCIGKVNFKKGDTALIPIYSMFRDPAIWETPEKFNPDRFNSNTPPKSYLPFGKGPRSCIGKQLAQLEIKAFLARIFSQFEIVPNGTRKLSVRADVSVQAILNIESPVTVKFASR